MIFFKTVAIFRSSWVLVLFLLHFDLTPIMSQPVIHSHNDYAQARPLWNALENKAGFIEADIFPINGKLLVAHSLSELADSLSLDHLYIRPLDSLFKSKDAATAKKKYGNVSLFIDVKKDAQTALPLLYKLLNSYQTFKSGQFRIVISGDRGPLENWTAAPRFVHFDGRPFETYTDQQLARVAVISDSYMNHYKDSAIAAFVQKAQNLGKPCRLWGAPDDERTWKRLLSLGVDIINTDHVAEARAMLTQHD